MKGHLRERSPGHWAIVIDVRDPATGKRKRRWHSFAGSKRQAQIECAQIISKLQSGTQVDPTRVTVAEFFERWLEHMHGQCSPRTHERYSELCRKNLASVLGGYSLAKLQPAAISPSIRQGAHQRPPGRAGRALRANRPPHASGAAPMPTAGR
jgi:Phage integrase, N-terminal SAM-like domain/Arm DNA-binding domain